MTERYYMGIDPDMRVYSSAIVKVDEGGISLLRVYCGRGARGASPRELLNLAASMTCVPNERVDALAVEIPDARYAGRTNAARVQDLVLLAAMAGALSRDKSPDVRFVYPSEWKGQVPKDIHQRRTWDKLGVRYAMAGGREKYPVPVLPDSKVLGTFGRSDWKDISDSVGLALWMAETGVKEQGRETCNCW